MNVPWSIRGEAAVTAFVAIVIPVLALGCGAGRATKAGKASGPLVLRMASRDSDQALYDPAAAYFVSRVGQLSGGQVRIVVVSDWASQDPAVEQQIVRDVATDKVDLGAAGTRVFDTLGVSSFQALTAPMLIDSYPLEREVIASDIPAKMLDGLDTLGVTGLAVLGEGLRKPVAVNRLLLGPSDWHGVTFAAFRSRGAANAIRALGARPSDLVQGTLTEALARRRVQGAENDLLTYQNNDRQTLAPYVTANVNLWPRTEALFANPHRLSELTHEQQSWLRQAAADTAARSTSLFDHDRQIAAFLCKSGAHLANASHSELVALRAALAPVYARLEENAETKAFIVRIQQLKRSTPGRPLSLPPACSR
jgi:TRAP-type transport system periplasmic protein